MNSYNINNSYNISNYNNLLHKNRTHDLLLSYLYNEEGDHNQFQKHVKVYILEMDI